MEKKKKQDWLAVGILIGAAIISLLFVYDYQTKEIAQAYRAGYEEGYDAAIRTLGVKVEPNDDPGPGQYHSVPTPTPQPEPKDECDDLTPTPTPPTPTPVPPTPEREREPDYLIFVPDEL